MSEKGFEVVIVTTTTVQVSDVDGLIADGAILIAKETLESKLVGKYAGNCDIVDQDVEVEEVNEVEL